MTQEYLDATKSAVLFFDMLNIYCAVDEDTRNRVKPMVTNCARIMEAARSNGIPIFYTQADLRPDGSDVVFSKKDTDMRLNPLPDPEHPPRTSHRAFTGSWEASVIKELSPSREDYIIPKIRWSAFYQTKLEICLRSRGADTIILAGTSTDIGVAATAYSARDRDFNLIIVRDACQSGYGHDVNNEFMSWVFPRMARIRTTEQVVEMMRRR